MSEPAAHELVPDDYLPRGTLPSLRWRDLPEPVPLRTMVGPSVILAGLALGSGEFVLWPYITYKAGFVFVAACMLGVATQYFMNMEITRWSLATGESATTGFCRMSRWWAPVFLALNLIPWLIPAWAKGAAQMTSWLVWGVQVGANGQITTLYETELAIAGLLLCGAILTLGPVIYETVERIQLFLVSSILILIVVLALRLVRGDAVSAMAVGAFDVSAWGTDFGISRDMLLGAVAFAGAGGTMNLGQSNYVKEKGYGMGHYIGRITSPITGKEEPVSEVGYTFPATPENLARWRVWWRRAGIEHFVSFFLTCVVCLLLLQLISYSIFYGTDGQLLEHLPRYKDTGFLFGEATHIREQLGSVFYNLFFVMGVAIFLTTEFGVLDVASRISTDIVKVNWLADDPRWSESRLYYLFLWTLILAGCVFLSLGVQEGSLWMFRLAAALNGAVMFIYCGLLVYLNRYRLPPPLRMNGWRLAIMLWSVAFFGFFAVMALAEKLGWLSS